MRKKHLLKVGCFVCLLCMMLGFLAKFLQVNNFYDQVRIKGFYMEPEDSLDVVFIGASEAYNAFSPGMAWEQYGFTSYVYATSGAPISLVKSQLIEVQKTQSPKLIVIEINGALYGKDEYQTRESALRSYIDNIPWSENKVDTIRHVVPKEEQQSYFVPFLKYHSNWKRIDTCARNLATAFSMWREGCSLLKGQKTITTRCFRDDVVNKKEKIRLENSLIDVTGDVSEKDLSPQAEECLRDLLTFCQREGMDNVLFIRAPHQLQEKNYASFQRANRAGKIIEEYGFPFLNLEYEKDAIGLDVYEDFYDKDHLNIYGNEKFTRYFGAYLMENYGELSQVRHDQDTKQRWDETARKAEAFAAEAKRLTAAGKPRELSEEWCYY